MDPATHVFLFTVSDRVAIDGKGVVLAPGIPDSVFVRKGEVLVFRSPLGEVFGSSSWDIGMINYRPGGQRLHSAPILLRGVHTFDVPIGTEVYLKKGD
jgi:hypothetical protein